MAWGEVFYGWRLTCSVSTQLDFFGSGCLIQKFGKLFLFRKILLVVGVGMFY